jgi:hypothetical protein
VKQDWIGILFSKSYFTSTRSFQNVQLGISSFKYMYSKGINFQRKFSSISGTAKILAEGVLTGNRGSLAKAITLGRLQTKQLILIFLRS